MTRLRKLTSSVCAWVLRSEERGLTEPDVATQWMAAAKSCSAVSVASSSPNPDVPASTWCSVKRSPCSAPWQCGGHGVRTHRARNTSGRS